MGGSLDSRGNLYEGNIAPQGSIIMSTGFAIKLGQSEPAYIKYTNITMIGDTFSNNIGGIFQATYLSEMLVDDTRFVNNTSIESMPGILISDFAIKFTCIKRISASISLTIGSVSYLPGLLVTNTQICK